MTNFAKNIRYTTLILFAIIVLGLFLRVYNLGEKSFWLDEFKTLRDAQRIENVRSIFTVSEYEKATNRHPPLFFFLLKIWLSFGESEFFLRLLPVIFAVIVIPLTYLLGKQFFEQPTALIGSFFVAISPFMLLYDRELKMYPLFVLLSIVSILFFLRAFRENNNKFWAIYAIATILNLYTHYYASLVIMSCWIYFLLSLRTYKFLWKKFFYSQVVIVMGFSLWLPNFMFHYMAHLQNPGWQPHSILGSTLNLPYIFYSFSLGQTVLPWNLKIVLVGGMVFGLAFFTGCRSLLKNRELKLLFFSFFFMPLFLTFFLELAMPKYFLFIYPLFALLIAHGIRQFQKRSHCILLIVAISTLSGISLYNYYIGSDFHILAPVDPWREVGKCLRENVKVGDGTIYTGRGEMISYYSGLPILPSDDPLKDLTLMEKENVRRIWLVVASPSRKKEGQEALGWLKPRYRTIFKRYYGHDPAFSMKAKFFRKNFLEYRIRLFLFEKLPPI